MNDPTQVYLPKRLRQADGYPKKRCYFECVNKTLIEWQAARIIENERRCFSGSKQINWSHRPGSVQFSCDRKFIL
jgi:hypothetical protein